MTLEGKQFSHYRILRLIGRGGMGTVYLVEDIKVQRQVAAKLIEIEMTKSSKDTVANALRLIRRETISIARLDHPNILPLYDSGEADIDGSSFAYLITPYRQHGSLLTWLEQRDQNQPTRSLTTKQIVHLIQQAGQALQYAHDCQVMHLDVKPANFLIRDRSGTGEYPDLMLCDFGIARLTDVSISSISLNMSGTPIYMAPEQWNDKPTFASDQYALAIMVYELLAGKPPFQGTLMQVMYAHVHEQPKPIYESNPLLPLNVDVVLQRALAKSPEQRFSSVATFTQALQTAMQSRGDETRPAPIAHSYSPPPNAMERMPQPHLFLPGTGERAPQPQQRPILPGVVERAPQPQQLRSRRPQRRRRFFILTILIICIVGGIGLAAALALFDAKTPTPQASAQLEPQFRFDASHSGYNPYEQRLSALTVLHLKQAWKGSTSAGIGSSPIVVNGMIYTSSEDGTLAAFSSTSCSNETTCRPVWKASTGHFTNTPNDSSPAESHGIIYVGSYDGHLYAFKIAACAQAPASLCKPLWSTDTPMGALYSSPTVANNVVYIGSTNSYLYAFAATNGQYLWKGFLGTPTYSSPAVADGMVYVGSAASRSESNGTSTDNLYAFSTQGCNQQVCQPVWKAHVSGDIESSPAVVNHAVYFGTLNGTFYAYGAVNGQQLWLFQTGGPIYSSPAVAYGVVYICSDDRKLYAFDASSNPTTKKLPRWTVQTGDKIRSSPTIANGVVYIGSDNGKLYAFNAASNATTNEPPLWTSSGNYGPIASSPAIDNGVVYVGSHDSYLYAFHL